MASPAPPTAPARLLETPTLAHPMESSRLFMALLSLVRDVEQADVTEGSQTIVAVPVLRRLLSAIHFRDASTLKHSRRVGLISVGIAARLGWEEEDLRMIEIAALLHDVGKIGIPDHILRKPGKLSPDEAEYIAVYHRVALAFLQACRVAPNVSEIVARSHGVDIEFSDRGSVGLGARILAVADAYDSLTTRQCYRAPYDRWEALQILEEQSGKQFDRNVVAALGRWLDGPDAAGLADERAAEVSIQVNAPVDMDTRIHAGQLCQLFTHLYLLESLYDAFYFVDSTRRIVIWNIGAAELFNRAANDVLRKKWSRQLVTKQPSNTDPMETVFLTGQSVCHGMTIQNSEGVYLDVDVQSIPIHGEDGKVSGVVELICNSKESKQHRGQFRSLQIAATRDPLTGVLNRGELERQLSEVYDSWTANPNSLFSVVFVDIDHFKSINDRLSHAVGDRVLVDVARLLEDELYSGEIVGRYGGEEFVVLCPETTLDHALERAERLRRTIMGAQYADRADLRVTASFGVAQVQGDESFEAVVERADQALYEAKEQGRNRTCVKILEAKPAGRPVKKLAPNGAHHASITTYVSQDMLRLKLTAFVEEHGARIQNVTPKQVVLQMGSGGLFVNWKKSPEKIPVKVTLDILDGGTETGKGAVKKLSLDIAIEATARGIDPAVFASRAAQIVDQIRSYLMAD